jgi:alpha-beta hydrolase superfamily lysophospholipase
MPYAASQPVARGPSATFRLAASDGQRIVCDRWDPQCASRGVVQVAHGLGEHVGRYAETIEMLQCAGFTVYGADHRGHGRTAPGPNHLGDFGPGGFDLLVDDLRRLNDLARRENPGAPMILLAHGLGAFAAQQFVLDCSDDIDGLALSGAGALDLLVRSNPWSADSGESLNAAFEPARTPFDWLSRDPGVVDGFIADPLCFADLQPGSRASFLEAAPRLADPSALRQIRPGLLVYIVSGSEDPVGQRLRGAELLASRYHRAGVREVIRKIYWGGRHEVLNEINRHEVRARLLAWIAGVTERHRMALKPRWRVSQPIFKGSPS